MRMQFGLDNIILLADSYKVSHHRQYPDETSCVYSYFESRGGKFPDTLFFGLQYILKKHLVGPVVTRGKINEARDLFQLHFGQDLFNEAGWNYILEQHGGYLPVRIKAVPEGTIVPYRNALFTVENTDPKCYWLTNFLETLLVQVWYPTTVATNSYFQKKILAEALIKTSDVPLRETLYFKLHDFGFRGVSSVETAGIGGAAHLVNFRGSDTVAGLVTARKYYGCAMAGFSVPAAEHSTITTWGRSKELEAFRNMLQKFPNGTVAIVSDSYNIYEACANHFGGELKEIVAARSGCLVVRPDSGDPATVVIKVLDILGEKFGTRFNSKGFKILPNFIRVLQGDGVSYESLSSIMENLSQHKWSIENLGFGSGGALLQRIDRDTQKFAYKCSSVVIGGEERFVFKEPIDDPGKKSKKGRLTVELNEEKQLTTKVEGTGNPDKDVLQVVFENGILVRDYTFDEIRCLAELDLVKQEAETCENEILVDVS